MTPDVRITVSVSDLERLLGWGYATEGREDWNAEDAELLVWVAEQLTYSVNRDPMILSARAREGGDEA